MSKLTSSSCFYYMQILLASATITDLTYVKLSKTHIFRLPGRLTVNLVMLIARTYGYGRFIGFKCCRWTVVSSNFSLFHWIIAWIWRMYQGLYLEYIYMLCHSCLPSAFAENGFSRYFNGFCLENVFKFICNSHLLLCSGCNGTKILFRSQFVYTDY